MANTEGMFCFEEEHVGCVCGWCEPAPVCQHTEVYSTGHCADCGEPIPDFEPTDAQIFAHYGQTKEVA